MINTMLGVTIFIVLVCVVTIIQNLIRKGGATFSSGNYVKEELENTARKRLEGLSGSFNKLALSFEQLTDPKSTLDGEDMNLVFEGISGHLCGNCSKCRMCWEKHFEESYNATCILLDKAKEQGMVTLKDLPEHFLKHCINSEGFVTETNRNLMLAKMKLSWHNRLAESREAVAGQLEEVARIVKEFSNDICSTGEIIELQKRKINTKLRSHRVKVQRVMMFERENRGMELHIRAKCKDGRCITTKEAAMLVGLALNKKFVPREDSRNVIGKDYADYVFCEDANFKVLTGVARASKVKGELSGDNFSFLYPDSSDVVMMLSDGMGTGEEASRESEMVIELLEEFLEAGFQEEPAVKLINSVLVLKSEHTMFSTVDLCVINLCAGTCEFVKVGAATTFIKRSNWVETISSTTMPAGMLNRIEFERKCKKLYDGDFVIMVSDGVLDCIDEEEKEEFLQKVIMNITCKSPQEIANAILTAALMQHSYEPVDDMTVLVSGIWEK
ncbi:SpoIIE family protein phosphatase [Clostridium sp. Marseille-P299]|uniref:SpoIIE family protein phosphatase n=1 Tax=Clostridium sp. Marseille-P299 TaxID=1805477 RepID=UPI00083286B3|nr:SpoIIE family protein phosphatase [Clostridium sp. Marseille-P299]